MIIINGKALAEKIKDTVTKEIFELKGSRPNLAIILIGDREDSVLYVNLKEKEAKKIGIDTHIYRCPADITEREVFDMINFLNNDESIDAILVQLPLPAEFDTDGIILAIRPEKDVDCFHPDNLEKLFDHNEYKKFIPPLIDVILYILEDIKIFVKDKNVCVIANSDIFGRSVARVIDYQDGKSVITNVNDPELKSKTRNADIIITAVGQAHFIKADMIKKDAVIIDIGISKKDGKVTGDVDFEDVKDKVGYITPVPGGVGPMTIAMLFKKTMELYKRKR
jgi:methylenetetrahydrofolate dehydrogenase (NADP+) / methenyltetrahydrofolate cyclohydrolase